MTELRNLKLDLIKLAARHRGGDWRETDDRGGLLPEGSRRVHAAVETLLEALEKAPPLWDELLWELGYEFPPEPFFALPTCHEYHGEDCECDAQEEEPPEEPPKTTEFRMRPSDACWSGDLSQQDWLDMNK